MEWPGIACLISTNIYSTPKPQLHFHVHCQRCSFQNTCHLSRCLCRWCQTLTTMGRRKEFSIHSPTMGNGCMALSQIMVKIKSDILLYLCYLLFASMVVCNQTNVKAYFFIKSLERSQTHLQTFHFTIRTSSTNSGLALRPRFAATNFSL